MKFKTRELSLQNLIGFSLSFDIGSGAAATGVGAAIGSAFLPPLGTVVGAGVGAFTNYVLNDVHIPFLGGKTTVDFVKDKAKDLGNWLGGLLGG